MPEITVGRPGASLCGAVRGPPHPQAACVGVWTERKGRWLEQGPRSLGRTAGVCVSAAGRRISHPPGGLVRNSWSGEKGPGPCGVSIRTLTVYVVSGCSSVSKTLASGTILCHSSSCGRGLRLAGPAEPDLAEVTGGLGAHGGRGVGWGMAIAGLCVGFRPKEAILQPRG